MWADVGSVTGAVAAVSVTLEKTKLGGLVRHQCVMATGTDLTWTQCHIDRGRICMENCFMNGENLLFLARLCLRKQMLHFFFKLAASRGDNSWDTSNQPQCMCDTCFFIQSSCLFIFCHNQNASCYFLPSSVQTNNRCERLEHILPSPLPLVLCCDYSVTTFALSLSLSLAFFPSLLFPWSLPIPRPLCGDKKLHPSPTRSLFPSSDTFWILIFSVGPA